MTLFYEQFSKCILNEKVPIWFYYIFTIYFLEILCFITTVLCTMTSVFLSVRVSGGKAFFMMMFKETCDSTSDLSLANILL